MVDSIDRQHVYIGLSQHKKLAMKKADVYMQSGRKITMTELLEWLVDNHLDQFPME